MRAHAELIKRWADDPTMEIESCYENFPDEWALAHPPLCWHPAVKYREKPKAKKLVPKWLWAIQIGEETLLSVYFCKDEEEVFNRYRGDVVILCRIEASKIEVNE